MSKKFVQFHIKSDDYFCTLATGLSLIRQTSQSDKKYEKRLDNIVKDLIYLQKEYKIVRK